MHIDQLIFILLIALAGLFKLLTNKAGQTQRDDEPPRGSTTSSPANQPRPTAESDEERIRRFLEALGQPTSSTPPPPVVSRKTAPRPTVVPQVKPFGSPLPPLTTRPLDSPRETPPALPRQVSAAKPPAVSIPAVAPPTFEVHTAVSVEAPVETYAMPVPAGMESTEPAADLSNLLGSTSALRNAIILREIFGPPRSLQGFDLIGN